MVERPVNDQPLRGLRVLVVEDDYFLAIELCSALRAAGADILGPARDVQTGLAALDGERIDCGVLDINLRGRMGFQIANELRARSIPTIFTTGYDASMIPPELGDVVRLEKPVDLTALCRAIEAACSGQGARRLRAVRES
jgi:DNA-binding response OmpR family regulator